MVRSFQSLDALTSVLGNYNVWGSVAAEESGHLCAAAQLMAWICCPGAGASLALEAASSLQPAKAETL